MASLTLDIPEGNTLVPLTPRITDDLPAHIKGNVAWHQGCNRTNLPTYWVSINNQDTPVELINNCWFVLQLYCRRFCTKRSLIIALKNSLGLNIYSNPPQIQALTTHTGFGFDPNVSLSESSRESTATQQSFSDAQETPELHIDTTVTSQEEVPPIQTTSVLTPLFTQGPEDPPENLNPDLSMMITNLPPVSQHIR